MPEAHGTRGPVQLPRSSRICRKTLSKFQVSKRRGPNSFQIWLRENLDSLMASKPIAVGPRVTRKRRDKNGRLRHRGSNLLSWAATEWKKINKAARFTYASVHNTAAREAKATKQNQLARIASSPATLSTDRAQIVEELSSVNLKSLTRIATLGVGAFGRVELVCINGDAGRTFALKALKKKQIVDTRQQEHIFGERNIMLETNTNWIVKLFKTFRDTKYVYMLLEVCLGGELWAILRDRGHFDDYTARFYVSCVLEGLEYLHCNNIVYRDLKQENCLLTETGYLKLADFGLSKKLASGSKAWTFCGTPGYLSPEMILNKGHDQSADYWALGIYICHLMLGRPPFRALDSIKTYGLILKGVDALEIPNRRIGETATALVKKLCCENPAGRIGSGSGGVHDIRKHPWFIGFDWGGLRSGTLKPPTIPIVIAIFTVSHPADHSNFDKYPLDQDLPPDEFSGWDEGF